MNNNKNTIGPSLLRLRETVSMSQVEAAQAIGTHSSYLSKVEAGNVTVTSKWVGNASSALGKAVSARSKVTL
ncbi:helix-turn-helix transcriptional regulator [Jonesiaceae bacterium BS-20]|uniref:Helix-turn-helix transcriptional regulator n=1 Tax=Jonesiaceae bacterium BS-20 TaxID=3120821 RepID=A0AAU7E098_9MICO